MKKYQTLILFFFFCKSFSQISYEHTYANQNGIRGQLYAFQTQSELFYYTITSPSSYSSNIDSISIFDENHVSIETIPVNGKILYITDKLFNNDDEIELLVLRERLETSPDNYATKDIVLIDHLGNIIFTFADRFAAHLLKSPSGSIKLIVDTGSSCYVCPESFSYDVYSIAGVLSTGQEHYLENKSVAYPIPTEDTLTIFNKENIDGENILIEVYDNAGRKVLNKRYTTSNHEINVDVSGLKGGTYFCQYLGKIEKFIKI